MSIATAEVLPTSDYRGGWTLQVTGTWPASTVLFPGNETNNHAQFPLTPNTTPKVTLTVVTVEGYTREGGQAVPATHTRNLVATKPLRKPYSALGAPTGSQLDAYVLDERDNGDGTRTVWLALSEPIYAGEVVTASFAAGWRDGQDAVANVPVVNNSDRQYPLPITRWAVPQRMPVIGKTTQRVDTLIASHFPRHFGALANQAVAAVRFDVTDGTTTNSVWVTEDSISPLFGDNLLCWGAVLDLTGLNPGMVQASYTVYPWIGSPRTIGATRISTVSTAFRVRPDVPLMLGYDPDDSFFGRRYIYVDPVNGTSTVTSITRGTTLAAAKAGNAARTISAAVQATYNGNFTLPASNGFSSFARAAPYWEIVLAPGVHSIGGTAVSTGYSGGAAGYLIIRGDPDDPNPRANCILRSPDTVNGLRNSEWLLEDMTTELGDQPMFGGSCRTWVNRVSMTRKASATALTAWFAANNATSGQGNLMATEFSCLNYGPLGNAAANNVLLRSGLVETTLIGNGITSKALVTLTAILRPGGNYTAISSRDFGAWQLDTASATTDNIMWGCQSLRGNGRLYVFDGDENGVITRSAVVNNLYVRANTDTAFPVVAVGENNYSRMEDCIIEGNTVVGQRFNWHNDPPTPTNDNRNYGNRSANNYFDWQPTKHDVFPTESGNRTGAWTLLYGVSHFANVDGERVTNQVNFLRSFYGLGSARGNFPGPGGASIAAFVDDQSNVGPNAVGGVGQADGDYRPGAGSALLGRAVVANTRQDVQGNLRGETFSSGAVEGEASPTSQMMVDPAMHMVRSAPAVLSVGIALEAETARLVMHGTASALVASARPSLPSGAGPELRTYRVRKESRTEVPAGE